jgi:hypothetical protein
MSTCAWTHRVARLRGWKPNSSWTRIWLGLGFSNWASNLGLIRGAYIREGGGTARWFTPLGSHCRLPCSRLLLLVDLAVWRCNTSSHTCGIPWRCCILEHKDELHERDYPRAEGGHDGWPRICTALLQRVWLHRVASAAPAHLVVIP